MGEQARVLVLDDEPIVCERLQKHLSERGFQVETFTDSQEALKRLREARFDVVVTDLKMKGPTGLDVLRFVKESGGGTQVVLITGYGSIEVAREAEYAGVFAFVHKPFQLEEVSSLVKKAAKKAAKVRRA